MQKPPPIKPLDYETWERCLDHIDKYEPAEVPRTFVWNHRDRMSPETLQKAIHYIWGNTSAGLLDLPGTRKVDAGRPQRLTPTEWKILFEAAGGEEGYFAVEQNTSGDGFGGPGCEKPTTLYRFAEATSETGWSWTASTEHAAYFETGYAIEPRHGRLWKVDDVDPARILAHFHTEIQAGNPTNPQYIGEFVFEPRLKEIVPVP